jgi:hypothetical protein
MEYSSPPAEKISRTSSPSTNNVSPSPRRHSLTEVKVSLLPVLLRKFRTPLESIQDFREGLKHVLKYIYLLSKKEN